MLLVPRQGQHMIHPVTRSPSILPRRDVRPCKKRDHHLLTRPVHAQARAPLKAQPARTVAFVPRVSPIDAAMPVVKTETRPAHSLYI